MTEPSDDAVNRAAADALITVALPGARAALFLDVDGTLLDIAPRPDAVVVPPELPGVLLALAAGLDGALALVSGRRIADLDHLFAPARLAAAGAHGAEIRRRAEGAVETLAAPLPAPLRAALGNLAERFPGVLVEDKGIAVAVHSRAVPDLTPTVAAAVREVVAASRTDGLALLPGKAVIEVKPAGMDKGRAILALLAAPPFAGRSPIFVGDDVTDEAGFAAVLAAGGTAIAVGRSFPGAVTLPDPAAVRVALTTAAASR